MITINVFLSLGFTIYKIKTWIDAGIIKKPIQGKFTEESYLRAEYALYIQDKYKITSLLDLVIKVDELSELFAAENPRFAAINTNKIRYKKLKKLTMRF